MKVYVDVLLLFNFVVDLLLLMSVSYLLKRNTNFYRLCLGAFIGSFSTFILFLPVDTISLFLLKILLSILMILATFSYHSLTTFWKNIGYFYFASIVLGGMICLWNMTFSYGGINHSFIANSYQLNFFGLLLLSPIGIACYVRKMRQMQEHYQFYQKVAFSLGGQTIVGVGYVDSGNSLTWKGRPVILTSRKDLSFPNKKIAIPYQTASGIGMLFCYSLKSVQIENRTWKNVYLGVIEQDLKIDGVDFLLYKSMMGESND